MDWVLISNITLIILGAILYRVRGGLGDINNNKIYFPLFIGLLYGWIFSWDIKAIINGTLGAYIAQQIAGWGAYRGSLIAGAKPATECSMIDDIINSLKITVDGRIYQAINMPRFWGFLGCSLRGLVSSYLIGSNIPDSAIKYCGILVGVCYLIPTIILWKTKYHNTKLAWNLGEYLEGALYVGALLWGRGLL